MAEGVNSFAEEMKDNEVFDQSIQFGRGRGFFRIPSEPRMPGPTSRAFDTPVLTSTRYVDRAMPSPINQNSDLSSLISEIAEKVGQSITAQLRSDNSTNRSNSEQPAEMTLSNVKLVMQSDVKEPPIFRGDGSDKLTVQEWENIMSLYLRKRAIPTDEQSQEILDRLMGKAGGVVKIKLRNNTSADCTSKPRLIFDILKQHFSTISYSSMPLADFYNTLPMPSEDAMEYWIRLNKTMDVAKECLERQGRRVCDPSHEISMMFIKHCPDKSLSNVFKFKSAEKWSAGEIQERLDEHMQERKARTFTNLRSLNITEHRACTQSPDVVETVASNSPLSIPPSPMVQSGSDSACMKSLVSLLDRLVTQQTQFQVSPHHQATTFQTYRKPCRVCRSLDHSTVSHCRQDNRCLKCLTPGHWKKDCPQRADRNQHQLESGAGRPPNQLNY